MYQVPLAPSCRSTQGRLTLGWAPQRRDDALGRPTAEHARASSEVLPQCLPCSRARMWTATSAHAATLGGCDRRRPACGARKTAARRSRAVGGRLRADVDIVESRARGSSRDD
ncbi:hypothetical protein B0H10DRAFT_1975960 [Mycena sp. CBHHK59/15]|nr:hypothetical protein B0H10DRAFT_1975960 [Mycena sp. CBHHK59/15]